MKKQFIQDSFGRVKKILQSQTPHSSWCYKADLEEIFKQALKTLFDDMEVVGEEISFLYGDNKNIDDQTEQTIALFHQWHRRGAFANSFSALAAMGVDALDIEPEEGLLDALLCAAVLADIENDPPYHSNLHFREVFFQTLRLIKTHNSIYTGTSQVFSDDDAAMLLIAAAIHDLGHTGQGNSVEGVHYPAWLEIRSFELAQPYLEGCGLRKSQLHKIRTMLVATDVSPIGSEDSPMWQMKRAYAYHFQPEKKHYKPILSEGLLMLEGDPVLARMAMLLHEADISISAGLSYDVTQYETALLWEEMGRHEARPSDILNFLELVCQRHFYSDAGKRLFGTNIARIHALAQEAVNQGDEILPNADNAAFLDSVNGTQPPTIN